MKLFLTWRFIPLRFEAHPAAVCGLVNDAPGRLAKHEV